MQTKEVVKERYSEGAKERQETLCCPVDYDASLLKMLPQEIIDKDYGCGDPSRYVRTGDTVLDLGSGGGKICYMAAQLVGPKGAVIGVDVNDDMLALAQKYRAEMAEKLGADPVEFRKGYIQDLALSLEALDSYLNENKVENLQDWEALEQWKSEQRKTNPLIADESVDVVVSNCVLNLVAEEDRTQLIDGIFRVLKPGGRVAISDIIADQWVDDHLKNDPVLWSGCISGAFHEKDFLDVFLDAGFVAVQYDKWDLEPWQVVEGVEFRSVTIMATKPFDVPNHDVGQAALYKGAYKEITLDSGQTFQRGERRAISERSATLIASGAYGDDFVLINPEQPTEPKGFCASNAPKRPATEMKNSAHCIADSDGASQDSGCC
ncbi:MAG: methyltransferase [Gammaproteobacteria bacterium]|nr:MAG: methyltransferase [Gammaproteobacteria bacterium]